MKLSDFRYTLPKSQVAKHPAKPRDNARLLVLNRKTGEIEDKKFSDIVDYVNKGDSVVVNESRVFPARLIGKKEKTNAQIEVMLLRELSQRDALWDVIVDPARKVRIGNKIYFDDNKLYCEVIDNTTSRGRTVRFNHTGDLFKTIERIGLMPLPPYIASMRETTDVDRDTYQTIFAKTNGSVAAPTAGLHFSKKTIARLDRKGVKTPKVMLHINRSTFDPVEVEDLTKHKMHSEYFEIPLTSAEAINKTIKSKGSIVAVGASVVRALESSVLTVGMVKPNRDWTDKFIYPPYNFKIVQKLLTNFHPPESTPLMMVCAFAGRENVLKAYRHAVKQGYRFLSYGDAMLII